MEFANSNAKEHWQDTYFETKISNANRTRGMRLNSCEVVRESILILREGSENKMRMDVDRPAHL